MLGITVYLNRPTPTPLRIAEVTAPASNCASVAFTDKFSGTTLDTSKWIAFSNSGGTATIDNKLTLYQPASSTLWAGESNFLTEGKVEIEGDFVQEVTLQSLTTTPETNNLASFLLGLASPGWKNWYRIEIYKNGDIQTHTNTNDVRLSMTPVNVFKNTPTKLKMVRSGSTLTTYYDVGAGYVLHSTVPNIYTGKVFVQLDILSHAPDKPAVTAVVKDFSLRCPPLSTTPISCSQGYTDSFDSHINPRYTLDYPNGTKIGGGLATFTQSSGTRIRTQIFSGDFVSTLNIASSNSSSAIPTIVARYLEFDNVNSRGVKIKYDKSTNKVESFRVTSPDGKTDTFDLGKSISISSSEQPSAFKIERQGSTFRTYFKTASSNFQPIGTYDNLTTENVIIRFGADNNEKTVFDSFSMSCLPDPKTSAPLNPRVTCNPDGKSVRLQWDGVTDVDSYKVRLDDKNGKVTNYDNLKDPQYIATIVPDKMYSFWAHSHKGGLDSNQSTAIDFTCKATATPTPKPTVKPVSPKGGPTVKPTSTPISKGDVVPTDTPAPSIKASLAPKSSPTNPSYVAPTPTPSPVETVSTNPVSRFFRWLAGLFE